MADATEVVLYDIDTSAPLDVLYADPSTRWYAVKMMAKEAVMAAAHADEVAEN